MMRILYVLFLLVFYGSAVLGQDKLLLMNGKEYTGSILDTSFLEITFQTKPGKKPDRIERYRVFSINYNQQETILYKQDTLVGNHYTTHEMLMYVNGEKDAINHFKTNGIYWYGFAAGFTGSFVQPYIFGKTLAPSDPTKQNPYQFFTKGISTPIIPLTFSFIVGSKWIKIDKKDVSNSLYLSEDAYLGGFSRVARGKRIQRAILGSASGWAVGFLGQLLTK